MRRLKRILKWLGITLGVLLVFAVAGLVTASGIYESRASATFDPAAHELAIPDDPALAQEAERLYFARGCAECHGADGAGRILIDIPPFLIAPPNLTGIMRALGPNDLHRIIRRGIRQDGTPLLFMPAHEYQRMPDEELGLITMHVRSLPQSPATHPASEMRLPGRVLFALGVFDTPMLPAEVIDHEAPFRPVTEPDLGEYIAAACTSCHGPGFGGGPIPGAPEEETGIPPNLTFHESGLARWSLEDLTRLLREGRRPDGSSVDPDDMPWRVYRYQSDAEIAALYGFLRALEPVPFGSR